MNHRLDLILSRPTSIIIEHQPCLSKRILNSLQLLNTHDHILLSRRLPHHAVIGHFSGTLSCFLLFYELLFNLFEPAHHFRMLSLHHLQLRTERQIFRHLGRVLLIHRSQIRHNFCMLNLHMFDFCPPFQIFLVLLLP